VLKTKPAKKAKKAVSLPLRKYRKGMPWMFADAVPAWIQKHQLETYGKNYTLTECEEVWKNMRRISDAAKHAGDRESMVVKHDPHTNRWASYETADDVVILASKGKLKEGGYADRCRGIMPCSRDRMREILASRFDGLDCESVWNVCRNNGYIRFDSAKEGYSDTWRSWDVDPPAAEKNESPFTGTKHQQYCYLVKGIDKSRHHYGEPFENSQFLRELDRRVVETGFVLDTKSGQLERYAALNALRHRIHNVTKVEELRPLAAEKQQDGSWLLWDRNLGFVVAEEQARMAKLPKWRFDKIGDECYIGKHEVDFDQDWDLTHMEPRTQADAIKFARDMVGFEWNVKERLDVADLPDAYPFRVVNGLYRGSKYQSPEEKAEMARIVAEAAESESRARIQRMADHEVWCKQYDAEIWDKLDDSWYNCTATMFSSKVMVEGLPVMRRLPLCLSYEEIAARFPQYGKFLDSNLRDEFLRILERHGQIKREVKLVKGERVWGVWGIDLTLDQARQIRDDMRNEVAYHNKKLAESANEKAQV
jgi:hypothetical protein